MTIIGGFFAVAIMVGALVGASWSFVCDKYRDWKYNRLSARDQRRLDLTRRMKSAEAERDRIHQQLTSGQITTSVLIDSMNINHRRAERVIEECQRELELLELESSDERLKEIESL